MNSKKILALILALGLMLTVFVACGNKTESGAKTQLVMATEGTFPPYEYMEGNEVVGVDVDIAKEIAKEMGVELKVDNMTFDAVIPAVQSGKADFGAAGISITEDRQKEVDFSVEYAVSMQVILTKADSGITGEADLAGKNIGVQLGTVADIVLTDDYSDVNLVRGKKYTDLSMDLTNGNVNGLVLDVLTAKAIQKQNPDFIILEEPLFTDSYAICVKKGNDEMLKTINTVLERLMAEGKIVEYTTKHLG